ncbi:MAG: hypothetical protein J6O17_01905 [Eubacterium sp.]|nr:hypothetical protein [Eubacterium sp.]
MKKLLITFFIVLLLLGGGVFYLTTFKLKEIEVVGCDMASADKVKKDFESRMKFGNTLEMMIRSKFDNDCDIPFVAKTDIEYVNKNKVRIQVYEKSVAGCIQYMENYIYFDKDGIVLETSPEKFENVPYIKGLKVKSWEYGEELPLEDKKKFNLILNITQLIYKYGLVIDGIQFTQEDEIILHYDNIEVLLGDGSNLAVQMMNLGSILDGLDGKKGVLYMKEFNEDNSTASFKVSK